MESEKPKINLEELSPQAKKDLMKQLAEDQKSEKEKRKSDVATLKQLQNEFLEKHIDGLADKQLNMEETVANIFKDFDSILELKKDVYGLKILDQESHTVTDPDGKYSITIGHNITITFDGTESAGVQKIMDYLSALVGDGTDEEKVKLGKSVTNLLKPNIKTRMLNPSKIIQLNQMRSDFNSPEFDDAMEIIINAQNRTKGSTYVSGWKMIKISENFIKKLEFRFTV